MAESESMLAPGYLDDVEERTLDEIRAMRTECIDVETGLSYLRRMVQGPLDIVTREQARRREGGEHDLATLVDELPTLLADASRPSGVGRLSQTLEPTRVDPELHEDLEALIGDGRMGDVTTMTDDELDELAAGLTEVEQRVSARRHLFFERIDALQAELTRRYQTGEASVESLLEGPPSNL